MEIISRVVLNTEEDKIFGTKINKNIREEILPYVILLDKEKKLMIKDSVKMNFNYFMEHSSFNENFKKTRAVENKTGLSVKDTIEKYKKKA